MALALLVMPEEFNPHPRPEVEEHIHWYGNGQEQAVEAEAAGAGAALWEVFFHGGRVEKTCERNQWNKDSQRRERQKHSLLSLNTCRLV